MDIYIRYLSCNVKNLAPYKLDTNYYEYILLQPILSFMIHILKVRYTFNVIRLLPIHGLPYGIHTSSMYLFSSLSSTYGTLKGRWVHTFFKVRTIYPIRKDSVRIIFIYKYI